jgi:hypothetical protein
LGLFFDVRATFAKMTRRLRADRVVRIRVDDHERRISAIEGRTG